MRYVTIEKAEPGMVLAKSIYDDFSRVLLGAYSTLTIEFITKLADRGFPGIYISDTFSDDIEIDETITTELRNLGVQSLRNGDIDATIAVAKSIVEQIVSSKRISLDLVDLRTFDDYTYRHSVNVAVLSTVIGMKLMLNSVQLEELCIAAIFHDLGKLMIDQNILNKPGKLTVEEFGLVKEHSQFSYDILKDRWNISATSKSGVLSHHENEDGSGYPRGLRGSNIHLYGKIIHVADVYDALTSKRPYKKPYALSEAIEYLMGGGGTHFDKKVVEAFLSAVPIYPKGVSVYLSDGSEAIVVDNSKNTLRPIIRFLNGTEVDLSENMEYLKVTICSSSDVEHDFSHEEMRKEIYMHTLENGE